MNRKPIAAFITDLHLKEDNIDTNKSIYKQAIEIVKSLGLKRLFGLGDTFESRKAQTILLLNTFGEILENFSQEKIDFISIVGNHDKASYKGEDSFLDEFRYHPNFTLVRSFDFFELTKDVNLHLLSFFHEKDVYPEYLKELHSTNSFSKKNILGTHIGIDGSKMNSGEVIQDSTGADSYNSFDLTLVGHFHDYQELNGGKIKYIGGGMQHNYGEDDRKGITILYDDLSTEQIKFNFPEYHKFEFSVEKIDAELLKQIKECKEQTNANIRIIITGDDSKVKAFDRSIFAELGVDCKLKSDEVKVAIEAAERNEFVSHTKESILTDFNEFCTTNEITDNSYGLEKLKSI